MRAGHQLRLPSSIRLRTDEELQILRAKGLTMVYMGLESGSDKVLTRMRKGHPAAEIIEMGEGPQKRHGTIRHCHQQVWAARSCWRNTPPDRRGLQRHEPGIHRNADADGGSREHLCMTGSTPQPPKAGPAPKEGNRVAGLSLLTARSVFRMNHASNYLDLRGITLNQDRDALLAKIHQAGVVDLSCLRPESWRGL